VILFAYISFGKGVEFFPEVEPDSAKVLIHARGDLSVYEKDASIITSYAAEVRAPIDLYVSAWQKFNSAIAQGLGHLDTSAVCKAIETSAGIDRKLVED
jgi:hypothetical protein